MSYLKYTTLYFNKSNVIRRNNTVNHIIALYNMYGHHKIHPHITLKQHAIISANIAKSNNENDKFILSTFLHDIGHLIINEHDEMKDFLKKDLKHEEVGYRYLERYYDKDIIKPILYHVKAKRYLCTVDLHYYNNLSTISKNMYHLQGGYLDKETYNNLKLDPHFKKSLKIKKYGDMAKNMNNEYIKIDMNYIEKLLTKYIII